MLHAPASLRPLLRELRHPGESDLTPQELNRLGRYAVATTIIITNVIGAVSVLVISMFVVPIPVVANVGHVKRLNETIAVLYVIVALGVGSALGFTTMRSIKDWLIGCRPPTQREIRVVAQGPLRLSLQSGGLWVVAALLFAAVNLTFSTALGIRIFAIVLVAGAMVGTLTFLLSDLCLRPVAARALEQGPPDGILIPGVATRSVLGWLLGTGLALVGIVAIGILALRHDQTLTNPLHQLGISMVVLGGAGLFVGLLAVILVARTTADPIDSVRRALAEVERGEFEVRVPVYDGTQIGRLQLGFNRMVAGLRERERIRDAFGAYVDRDVAERVMQEGIDLRGEAVEVSCMFIDLRNFTGFAEVRTPEAVLAAINELFAQFVTVIHRHNGRVDKFVGDGVLAVFGAPRKLPDHADAALRAALEITRTATSPAGLQFGIGVNSGQVVAGNVGGSGRVEFSVIGDAVNVAARVEAATRETGDVLLVSEATVERLRASHPALHERPAIPLKGKRDPVRLYALDLDKA